MIRRHLFAIATAVSLLLCLAMMSLWILSFSRTAVFSLFIFGEFHASGVEWGRIIICREFRPHPPGTSSEVELNYGVFALPSEQDPIERYVPQVFSVGSFEGWRGPFMRGWRSLYAVPIWPVVLMTLIIPIFYVRRRWQLRPIIPGHCRKCGYNLTANISGTCPECGMPVPKKPEAVA